MAIATGANYSFHYVREAVYGTTPATPVFKPFCITGDSVGLTRDAIESGCLGPDRQVKDVRNGNKQTGGEIPSELIYGVNDDFLESALMGTWATDVLKVGTTRRSYTFEGKFENLDTPEYKRTKGVELGGLSFSVAPNQLATIGYTVIGQSLSITDPIITGATYSTPSTNKAFDSFTGSILIDGVASAVATQLDFTLDNGMEPAFVLFNDETIRPTDGKSRVTGTLTSYYESKAIYEKFVNGTNAALVLTLQDPDGNTYEFNFPDIKITGGNPDLSGDGPVTLASEFSAIYDATADSQIVITRTAATP